MPRSELRSGDSRGHEDRHHSSPRAVYRCKTKQCQISFPTVPHAVRGAGGGSYENWQQRSPQAGAGRGPSTCGQRREER